MDLDAILRLIRTPGDVIRLSADAAGVWTTRGAWAHAATGYAGLAPGVTLDATGCTIELVDPVLETDGKQRPERDLQWPWLGVGAKIIGGKWNLGGNEGRHPGWSLSGFCCVGDADVSGVLLTGQRGSRGAGGHLKESFALHALGGTQTITDCATQFPDVRDEADAYVAGWYPNQGSVTRCSADLWPVGWWGFSCVGPTTFTDCRASAQFFWYTDWAGGVATIINSEGTNSYAGIGVRQGSAGRREVVVQGGGIIAPRAVEWDGADDGFVLLDEVSLDCQFSGAIRAKHGAVILRKCTGNIGKPHVVADSFSPTVIT
jgi:hypothetical protein